MNNVSQILSSRSYVPYSGTTDGCVVESKKGFFYPGVRIENISFPLTIGSIQSALFNCISEDDEPSVLYISAAGDTISTGYWKNRYDLDIRSMEDLKDSPFSEIFLPSQNDPAMILKNLLKRSVVPLSNFPVSALIETEKGYVAGVNIEEPSWDMGLCAERVALSKALSYGSDTLKTLHIHTKYGEYSSPCGACRQVIIEHMPNQPVVLHHADQTTSLHYSSDFLPYSFKSTSLKKST